MQNNYIKKVESKYMKNNKGYVRLITDLDGNIKSIKDFYCAEPHLQQALEDSDLYSWFSCPLEEKDKELLITFELESEVHDDYWNGRDVEEWIEFNHVEVLRENYKQYYKELIHELDKILTEEMEDNTEKAVIYFANNNMTFEDLKDVKNELYEMCDEYLMMYGELIELMKIKEKKNMNRLITFKIISTGNEDIDIDDLEIELLNLCYKYGFNVEFARE